jgi:isopenicillin N synthase-like dioxygenase
MLTLLATDGTPGLQIQPRQGEAWTDVEAVSGGLVVNLGDMLERHASTIRDCFLLCLHES